MIEKLPPALRIECQMPGDHIAEEGASIFNDFVIMLGS